MQYETQKTKAVVLREVPVGEADKFFELFSENFGKIIVLGKGIRKIKAKLKGGLQIPNFISLEFVKGRNFYIATEAKPLEEFKENWSSLKKYRASLYICWLLSKTLQPEERDEKIWELLIDSLFIIKNDIFYLPLAIRFFEWNLISFLGFTPELYRCSSCQARLQPRNKFYFSARQGGVICEKCFSKKKEKKSIEISEDIIKILRLFIMQDKEILKRLKINVSQERDLRKISKFYLENILEEKIFVI